MKSFKLSEKETSGKSMNKKDKITVFIIIVFFIVFWIKVGDSGPTKTQPQNTVQQGYPSFAEETMDRDCILSCEGGDWVVLWDKPTSASKGARPHDEVPCGTYCWAFNKYYNEDYNITFYAINTYDKRVENAWGWIIEDLITWIEE